MPESWSALLEFPDVLAAADRLSGVANRTPVLTSRTLNEVLGASLFLKAEQFQRGGAFKFRGAYNKVSQLENPAALVAYSSGNHAQAVALVARIKRIPATIVMPEDAPPVKLRAVKEYGAEVINYDPSSEDRAEIAAKLVGERRAVLIPPYDDFEIMAGAGTAALELFEEVGELDVLVVCIGGGGLIAGCATAAHAMSPGIQVIGVEPDDANDTALSMAAGKRVVIDAPRTEADGLKVRTPGVLTFPIVQRLVESVVTVSGPEISEAMAFLFERMSLVVEPSGAVALAAAMSGRLNLEGKRVGVVISGGNIGPERFCRLISSPWHHQHG